MSKLNYFYICMINFAATVKIVVDVVITDTSSTSCEVISDCHSLRNVPSGDGEWVICSCSMCCHCHGITTMVDHWLLLLSLLTLRTTTAANDGNSCTPGRMSSFCYRNFLYYISHTTNMSWVPHTGLPKTGGVIVHFER